MKDFTPETSERPWWRFLVVGVNVSAVSVYLVSECLSVLQVRVRERGLNLTLIFIGSTKSEQEDCLPT